MFQDNTATPLTKTQKRKQKKQLKEELKQRAKMIAEKQKQVVKGSAASSKSSKSALSSENTSSVTITKESDDSADGSNNTPSLSEHDSVDTGSSESSTKSNQIPTDDSLPSPSKRIRKRQRQQNLPNLGVGIVEPDKPSSFRKQQPSKKRRQLTKDDKVKHNSANPVARLILKHQNDSPALNAAAQRIAKEQEMRKAQAQNPRKKANNNPSKTFDPTPMQPEQALFAEQERLSWELLLASLRQRSQQEDLDDMSDRCVTIASDSDDENLPGLIPGPEDEDVPELIVPPTSLGGEDVAMPSQLSVADDNLNDGDLLSASSDFEDQLDEVVPSGDATTSHDTTMPKDTNTSDSAVILDDTATPHDAVDRCDIVTSDATAVLEEPTLLHCTIEAVSAIAEDASHSQINDDSTTPIEYRPDSTITKLPKAEYNPSWVSSMLSLPNAAQYPPALSVDRELALIAMHVTPLSLPESKQKASKATKSSTKTSSTLSALSKAAAQLSSTDPTTTIELDEVEPVEIDPVEVDPTEDDPVEDDPTEVDPAEVDPVEVDPVEDDPVEVDPVEVDPCEIETPFDNSSTQFNDSAALNLCDQPLPAEEKVSVDVAAENPGFVAHMFTRPNGLGQTAAVREQHETLVRLHVPTLEFSSAKTKEPKKSSADSTEHNDPNEDENEVAVTLLLPTDITPINNTPSTECTTVEDTVLVKDSAVLEIPLTPHLKPLPNDEPVSEVKVVEEVSILTSSSENSKFPDLFHQSSPTSRPSNSSKTSSRRSSVRSDELFSHCLEQKIYQARNTYLGIASLEDFLMLLDFDEDTSSTTKTAICEAFTLLSANEAQVIQGLRPATPNTDLRTAYAQHRIKLGTTTLSAFLRDIIFDDEGMTHVAQVMRSFKNAAQHDVQQSSKLAAALSLESASSAESSTVSSPLPSFRSGSGSLSPRLVLRI